jgi:hypothetical protein
MHLLTNSGAALATILATSLGYVSLIQAAATAGVAAAVPAVQFTEQPSATGVLPEKAYHHEYEDHYGYKPKKHRYHHGYNDHHGYDHHRYGHHRPYKYHPLHHLHHFLFPHHD